MRWFAKAAIAKGSAPEFAKPLRIKSVKLLSERSDVWCIQVDDGQCFSLANGAVVHNSHGADSWGLACLDYEEPRATIRAPDEAAVYRVGDDEAGTAWMAN